MSGPPGTPVLLGRGGCQKIISDLLNKLSAMAVPMACAIVAFWKRPCTARRRGIMPV